ncbi:MAG: RnfABCDGE type electron transport complex subunit D [Polyangiaceae bacterium]|nr:RnfABCDGE type electron transport complex subunit D [Polyangiaceae bacterium]
MTDTTAPKAEAAPALEVAPSPHAFDLDLTTRGMMRDVLLALLPPMAMAIYTFGWLAVLVVTVTTASCLAAEELFERLRGSPAKLGDLSAVVTGVILGLTLPATCPWWVAMIAGFVAIGIGKTVFGSLGQNVFNPAMVGRAFVMISFSKFLGAPAYQVADAAGILSQATPLTVARDANAVMPELWPMFLGTVNGSLGETSALACLLGGLYLCARRTASWEIPFGVITAVVLFAGLTQLVVTPTAIAAVPALRLTVFEHLTGGALVFGAFYIATDPVTSPITGRGKLYFGLGVGAFVWLIRTFSGYPEGVMFAVLLMNALVPLINRGTVPVPVGGPTPALAKK